MASKGEVKLAVEEYADAIVHPPKKEVDVSGSEDETDPESEILEDLTCAVCQSTYSDPRLLSCLHSFCKQCLSKLIARGFKSSTIKCPLCRNEHVLPLSEGVDGLMSNTQLASKLQSFLSPPPQPSCGECEDANVVSFCENCQNYLCGLCDQAHKRMASFKSHLLVPPDEAKLKPKANRFQCPKHPSEPLTVYCIKCKSAICRDCGLYDHNGHKFKPALNVSDQIKTSLLSNLEQLEAKLETFRSHAEEVAKVEKHVTVYPDEIKSFITSQFEEFHELLDKRKEVLLQQVDTQYNGFSKTLWAEKDIVETGICKLEAGIKFAQQLAESDDKQEVAVLGTKAIASMEKMNTLSLDPKAIKNLGPLMYMARERNASFQNLSDKDFIESIGKLGHGPRIVMTKRGYEKPNTGKLNFFYPSNSVAIKSYEMYHLDVQAQCGKLLFPSARISCTCSVVREKTRVFCTTKMCSENKWAISFQTVEPGSYFITGTLKLNDKIYCSAIESIHFAKPI